TDNVIPVVTGTATAIDLSAATGNVTINQVPDTVFTDDDTVDDDAATRPSIVISGAIRLGAHDDTINLGAGAITGDISFGAGNDAFNITNGAVFTGKLSDSDGALIVNVNNGTLNIAGGATNLTSMHIGPTSVLGVQITGVA